MKRKNVEAAREVRLWIGQIIVPGVTVLASALAIPEVRQAVAAKATELKLSIDQKIENLKKKNPSQMN
jgi:hypothetical protein